MRANESHGVDEFVHAPATVSSFRAMHALAAQPSACEADPMKEDTISLAGTTRAIVTVLRTLLDAQPDQDGTWRRLRAQYRQAIAGYDADPSLLGERTSFDEVFDMLGVDVHDDFRVVRSVRHAGGRSADVDTATATPTDGVDDASLY